jgi:hypothetical protein
MYFFNPLINSKDYEDETIKNFNLINSNILKINNINEYYYDTILISLKRKDKNYN